MIFRVTFSHEGVSGEKSCFVEAPDRETVEKYVEEELGQVDLFLACSPFAMSGAGTCWGNPCLKKHIFDIEGIYPEIVLS